MARTPRTLRRRASGKPRRPRPADETPRELDFNTDERAARIGDLVDPEILRQAMPARRVREAGMTGGEIPGREVTADDLSPETLLDDDASHTPAAHAQRDAMDTVLRAVDEAEIGEGLGKDEAELAQDDPLDPEEYREQLRRDQRAGGPLIQRVEPNETGAGSPARQRASDPAGGKP